jgi:hypothetical protein
MGATDWAWPTLHRGHPKGREGLGGGPAHGGQESGRGWQSCRKGRPQQTAPQTRGLALGGWQGALSPLGPSPLDGRRVKAIATGEMQPSIPRSISVKPSGSCSCSRPGAPPRIPPSFRRWTTRGRSGVGVSALHPRRPRGGAGPQVPARLDRGRPIPRRFPGSFKFESLGTGAGASGTGVEERRGPEAGAAPWRRGRRGR